MKFFKFFLNIEAKLRVAKSQLFVLNIKVWMGIYF